MPSAMAGISGPILFGYCLDVLLFGILTVQTYLYYLAFPNDRRVTKAVVYFVYIIGALQTALALHDFYTLFCVLEGQKILESLTRFGWKFGYMWFTIPVGGVLVAVVAQLFYAHRIYMISRAKVVTGIIGLLTLIQLACGIVGAVLDFTDIVQSSLLGSVGGAPGLIIGAAVGVICDLLIVIYMSLYLSRQMKGTSRTTQVLVTKVVRLLLETGILTATTAMVYLILFWLMWFGEMSNWYMIPGLSLGKLYGNSMLVLLNNRFTILGGRNTPQQDFDTVSFGFSELAGANAGPVVSRGIAFARSRRAETIFSGGVAQTVGLVSQSGYVVEESEEARSEAESGSIA